MKPVQELSCGWRWNGQEGTQRKAGRPVTGQERVAGVRDRVVQQAILNVIQPIFEPDFHPSSYGYQDDREASSSPERVGAILPGGELW